LIVSVVNDGNLQSGASLDTGTSAHLRIIIGTVIAGFCVFL
jgi:hypothetical protein